MTSAFHLAPIARLLAERMLNCVVEGMVIGLFAWLLLQVVGRRNSSTRFAVWFAALLGIASLPLIQSAITSNSISRSAASAVTLPSSWALYIFLAWALIAAWLWREWVSAFGNYASCALVASPSTLRLSIRSCKKPWRTPSRCGPWRFADQTSYECQPPSAS